MILEETYFISLKKKVEMHLKTVGNFAPYHCLYMKVQEVKVEKLLSTIKYVMFSSKIVLCECA